MPQGCSKQANQGRFAKVHGAIRVRTVRFNNLDMECSKREKVRPFCSATGAHKDCGHRFLFSVRGLQRQIR